MDCLTYCIFCLFCNPEICETKHTQVLSLEVKKKSSLGKLENVSFHLEALTSDVSHLKVGWHVAAPISGL